MRLRRVSLPFRAVSRRRRRASKTAFRRRSVGTSASGACRRYGSETAGSKCQNPLAHPSCSVTSCVPARVRHNKDVRLENRGRIGPSTGRWASRKQAGSNDEKSPANRFGLRVRTDRMFRFAVRATEWELQSIDHGRCPPRYAVFVIEGHQRWSIGRDRQGCNDLGEHGFAQSLQQPTGLVGRI